MNVDRVYSLHKQEVPVISQGVVFLFDVWWVGWGWLNKVRKSDWIIVNNQIDSKPAYVLYAQQPT